MASMVVQMKPFIHLQQVEGSDSDSDSDFLRVESEMLEEDALLAQWELVNASDADSDRSDFDYSLGDAELDQSPLDLREGIAPCDRCDFSQVRDRQVLGSISILLPGTLVNPRADDLVAKLNFGGDHDGGGHGDEYDDEINDHEDHDDDEEDDGLDDELVPRHLRDKFGRQRIRKLGKRGCSKMNYSKKSPHLFVKRGCLHGKHGLGLKHSL